MRPLPKLAQMQIDRRLKNLRAFAKDATLRTGWITYIREAMCITQNTLAKLVGLNQSTILQIEKREVAGRVTLQTMQKIAAAMNCDFVYAMIPKQELADFLKSKAIEKATRIVGQADVHMTLEDQRVTEDIKERIDRIADDLLVKGDIW